MEKIAAYRREIEAEREELADEAGNSKTRKLSVKLKR